MSGLFGISNRRVLGWALRRRLLAVSPELCRRFDGEIHGSGCLQKAKCKLTPVVRNKADIARFAVQRQNRVVIKLLHGSEKALANNLKNLAEQEDIKTLAKPRKNVPSKVTSRRAVVLNSVLLHYITEVIATGEVGQQIAGLGVEITMVRVSPDYSKVNVFWLTTDGQRANDVEEILLNNSTKLRTELIGLRVLGNVPAIRFYRDARSQRLQDLEALMERADYGPDFTPAFGKLTRSKSIIETLYRPLPSNFDINKSSEAENPSPEKINVEPEEGPLFVAASGADKPPGMRMDAYGLDHAELSRKVYVGGGPKRDFKNVVENIQEGRRNVAGNAPTPPPETYGDFKSFINQKVKEKRMLRQKSAKEGEEIMRAFEKENISLENSNERRGRVEVYYEDRDEDFDEDDNTFEK